MIAVAAALASPALPVHWKAQSHLTKEQQAFSQLTLIEQMEVCDHLDGPLFWILAQRSSERSQLRPCVINPELFWEIVPMPLMTGIFPVDQLKLNSPREINVFIERVDESLVSVSRGKGGVSFRYHQIAKAMLDYIDGIKSLREIASLACEQEGIAFKDIEKSLLAILHELIDVLALATPDYSYCTHYPNRCSPEHI